MREPKPLKISRQTPIQKLEGFDSKTEIFIKRDDLSGLLISGNKSRKLEYLVADAKRKKCDTLITCGGIQSNHCRITAAFANYFGFDCHLMLRVHGKPNKIFRGNLLIDKLLKAKVNYITPTQYDSRYEIMKKYAEKLKKKNKKPYIIPEGGSNAVGILGYRDCMKEMKNFIKKNKIDAMYCAVGSGGTYAGLLLGKKQYNLSIDLNGILVCDTIEYFKEKITRICNEAIDSFKIKVRIDENDIDLVDGFIGEGYAIPYDAELKTIKTIAKHGVILDPVYTGKTFYGMLQHLKKKRYRRVIFLHTGGIFSIFAYSKEYTDIIKRN
jgi:D-cysteine desulfhydrase